MMLDTTTYGRSPTKRSEHCTIWRHQPGNNEFTIALIYVVHFISILELEEEHVAMDVYDDRSASE